MRSQNVEKKRKNRRRKRKGRLLTTCQLGTNADSCLLLSLSHGFRPMAAGVMTVALEAETPSWNSAWARALFFSSSEGMMSRERLEQMSHAICNWMLLDRIWRLGRLQYGAKVQYWVWTMKLRKSRFAVQSLRTGHILESRRLLNLCLWMDRIIKPWI